MESKSSSSENYEEAASAAATEVASFEGNHKGFVGEFHNALHTVPALVPLVVHLASIAVFGAVLGSKFFSPVAMTLILRHA